MPRRCHEIDHREEVVGMTLLMMILFIAIGISAYVNIKKIDRTLYDIIDNEMIQREASYEMEIQLNRIGVGVLGFLLDEAAEHLNRIENGRTDFSMAWQKYQNLCTTDTGRNLGQNVKTQFEKIISLSDSLTGKKKKQSSLLHQLYDDHEKMDDILDNNIQAELKTEDLQYVKKMQAAMEMEININEIIGELNGFLASHNANHLENIKNDMDDFLNFFKIYQSLDLSGPEMARAREMQNLFNTNAQRIEAIIAMEQEEMADLPALILQRRTVQTILSEEVRGLTAADLEAAKTNSVKAVRNTVFTVIGLTLFGLIFGGLSSFFITRSIIVPLEKLSKWADRIASRDFSLMEIKTGDDEIGYLNRAFKQMTSQLDSFSRQTNAAVQNINTTCAEILAAIQQQAASIKEQAAAMQQTSTTMEEIRETGSQVSEKAKDVAQAAEATNAASETGIHAVEETHEIMELIRAQVEEVAQNIISLSEKTQAIGEIIATVNDIAEQSNLLAINAAIEAVGAGEQGQRFSVVANEIKNLADQARTSTVEVRGILSEIQRGIGTSVMSTEEAVKRVENGRTKSEIAAETIRQLTGTTTESIHAFQQIVAGTGQQQIGLDQVTQALKDIEQGTEQTSSGIGQIEIAVANLNDLSSMLKNIVESE